MKKLSEKEDFEIEVKEGISLRVRHCDSLDMALARARAESLINALVAAETTLSALGFAQAENLNLDDQLHRMAISQTLLVAELGAEKIYAWTGLNDFSGAPLDCTPENVRATLRRIYLVSDAFWRGVCDHHMEVLAAKKEYAAGAPGMPSPEPAAHTVTDV